MSDFKVLDELARSNGYDIALMTTYNFEIDFFERFILNSLFENQIKKVSVFVDAKRLNESLSTKKPVSIGKKYVVNPVEIRGAFHPKVILLLGKEKAKLFVESANLTMNGFVKNNEVFNVFNYDKDNQQNLSLVSDAIAFFERLNDISYNLEDSIFEEIKSLVYYDKRSNNTESFLLENLNRSILSQVIEHVSNVSEIDIAVPYYDNYLAALGKISEAYPNAKINLYIQNKMSNFPIGLKEDKAINKIYVYNALENGNAFYHGKVFRFITDEGSYILYGSANCTQSALTTIFADNGNIECSVLEKGVNDEFDDFFNEFKVVDEELDVEPLEFEDNAQGNFYFKYGVCSESIKLHLGFNKLIDDISVFCGDVKLIATYVDMELEVTILSTDAVELNGIFDICIKNNHMSEIVKCWFLDSDAIQNCREYETGNVLDRFSFESVGVEYFQERMSIIEHLSLCKEDIMKEESIMIDSSGGIGTSFEDDEVVEGEGIVHFVIPDAEIISERYKYIKVNKLRESYISFFLKTVKSGKKLSIEKNLYLDKDGNELDEERKVIILSESERYVRFVVRNFKMLAYSDNTNMISSKRFLETILVFEEQFERFPDLFRNKMDIILDCKVRCIDKLINKDISDFDNDYVEQLIYLALIIIVENKFIGNPDSNNLIVYNPKLLTWLNKKFDLRIDFERYLSYPYDVICEYNSFNYDSIVKYIDDLFGYKPLGELEKVICKDFPGASIGIDNGALNIACETETPQVNLKTNSIRQILNYFQNSDAQFDKVMVRIENIKKYDSNVNYMKFLIYEIDLETLKGIRIIERADGNKDKPEMFNLF